MDGRMNWWRDGVDDFASGGAVGGGEGGTAGRYGRQRMGRLVGLSVGLSVGEWVMRTSALYHTSTSPELTVTSTGTYHTKATLRWLLA